MDILVVVEAARRAARGRAVSPAKPAPSLAIRTSRRSSISSPAAVSGVATTGMIQAQASRIFIRVDYSLADVSSPRLNRWLEMTTRAGGNSTREGQRWRRLWPLLVALGLLGVLATVARPKELLATVSRLQLESVPLALGAMAVLVSLEAYRVRRAFGSDRLSFPAALGLTLRSALLAQLTPGMVGGEIYKVVWLRRRGVGVLTSGLLLGALRLLGLVSLALLALGALPLLRRTVDPGRWRDPALGWLGAAAMAGLLGLAVALVLLRRRFRPAASRSLEEACAGLRALGVSGALGLCAASLLIGLCRGAVVYLLLAGLGQRLGAIDVVAGSAIASLSSVVPVVPGGLGVQEGALAAVLIAAGASGPEAVSAALLHRFVQWLTAMVGGLGFLIGGERS